MAINVEREDGCGRRCDLPSGLFYMVGGAVSPDVNLQAGSIVKVMSEQAEKIEILTQIMEEGKIAERKRSTILGEYESNYRKVSALLMPYKNFGDYSR